LLKWFSIQNLRIMIKPPSKNFKNRVSHNRYIVLLLLLFLFPSMSIRLAFSQDAVNEAGDKLDRVDFLISEKLYDEAHNLLDEIESENCHPTVEIECVEAKIFRASIFQQIRDFVKSGEYLYEAEKLAETLYPDENFLTIKLNNFYVHQYTFLKKLKKAEKWAKKSLDRIHFLNEKDDDLLIAATYIAYGNLEDEKGNYNSAIEFYERALRVLHEPINKLKEYAYSNIHNLAGIAYRKLGEYGNAMYHFEKSSEYLSNLFPKNHPEIATNYNNRGMIQYDKGDIGSAINYFKQSAKILENFYGKNHKQIAAAHNNIGLSYYRLGKYSKAAEHLEYAQEIKLEVIGENHPETAIGYSNLASIYLLDDDYESAINNHEKSLKIRKANLGNDHPDLIPPYSQLGNLFVTLEQFEKAREYYSKAYKIAASKLDQQHSEVLNLIIDIGNSYSSERNFDKALNYYKKANQIVDSGNDLKKAVQKYPVLFILIKSLLAESHHHHYRADNKIQNLERALTFYEEAIYGIDEMQYSFQNEASKLRLVDRFYSVYGDAIHIADLLYSETSSEKYLQIAFKFAELSRAKITMENLQNLEAKKYAGIPSDILSEEEELNNNISDVYQELHDVNTKDSESELFSSLEDSLFYLQRKKESLIRAIESTYPEYYNLKFDRKLLDLNTVQKALLTNSETLLTYVVREDNLKIFVVSQEEVNLVTVEKSEDLSAAVAELRKSIMAGKRDQFIKRSRNLYMQLIEPIEDLLTTKSITIVPDQSLHYLPFELLLESNPQKSEYKDLPYFVKNHTISYAPSATLFSYMNERKNVNGNNLLAIAPYYNHNQLADISRSDSTSLQLNPLPLSGYEVKQISDIFKKRQSVLDIFSSRKSEFWLDSDASEERIKSTDLSRYGYLHFATHAFVNEEKPDLSGIYFQPDEKEDGILFVDDIYNMKLNAELVVLGACETGLGEIRKGEGIIGFVRAFIYAGAANLVTSQWKVNDKHTSNWMIRFYEEIMKGDSYSKAMQTVKKEFISNPSTADPRYWAAFILHGR